MWWCSHIERDRSLPPAHHVFSSQKFVWAAMTRTNDGDSPRAVQMYFTSLFRAAQSHVSRPMLEWLYGEGIGTIETFSWTLETHFLVILANRPLVWSTIAFCRATIFEFQKLNSINAGTDASPNFRSQTHAGATNFAFSRPHFWGRKMDPFLGPLVKILIRMVPFGGPKTGT